MSNVISEDKFKRKLLQKTFDDAYSEYFRREPCTFSVDSITFLFKENKIKVIEFYCSTLGYIDNAIIDKSVFLDHLPNLEWDYEFISDELLRVFITSSFWYDLYFSEKLTPFQIDLYTDLMEDDVLLNCKIMDDHVFENDLLINRINELQDEYFTLFQEELQPSGDYS